MSRGSLGMRIAPSTLCVYGLMHFPVVGGSRTLI